MKRRKFLRLAASSGAAGAALGGVSLRGASPARAAPRARPNIVLCMTDDQGWGDVGYNGHKVLKTPVLDEMAASGLRFDRFYAAAPVCSPTRGSVMTGRHPNRFGCFLYNYSIRPQEVTVAEAVKTAGYATGHFGKWHLGPVKAGTPVNPGGSGFDEWLSHDNFFEIDPPLSRNGAPPETHRGESSEIVVNEALRFAQKAVRAKRPFLAVVWFGSPHTPHKAYPEDRAPYAHLPAKKQHYLGEIAAVDRAMGMLRKGLRSLGAADDTLVWFCSDNGPTGPGSTGGLKGKKGSLWEGGVRVPGLIEWPARIGRPFATSVPCCTTDIYPTVVDLLGLDVPGQVKPIDGISLRELIEGRMTARPRPIPFWKYPHKGERGNKPFLDKEALSGTWRKFSNFTHPKPRTGGFKGHAALVDNRYKLHKLNGKLSLYDLEADAGEKKDIAGRSPEIVARMKAALEKWQASVERSLSGADYG